MTGRHLAPNYRWLKPFIQLLRQGVSPEKIALTIALGIILGVTALTREGVGHAVRTLWVVTMHALLAWLLLGIVALAILYAVLVPLLRQLWRRVHPSVNPRVNPLYGR